PRWGIVPSPHRRVEGALSGASLLWMLAQPELDWVEVQEGTRAVVDTPDDGRASLRVELSGPAAAQDPPQVGARTRVGVMFGILAHTLFDGDVASVAPGPSGLVVEATDLMARLDARHTPVEGTL